jgi:hypothetical protein
LICALQEWLILQFLVLHHHVELLLLLSNCSPKC